MAAGLVPVGGKRVALVASSPHATITACVMLRTAASGVCPCTPRHTHARFVAEYQLTVNYVYALIEQYHNTRRLLYAVQINHIQQIRSLDFCPPHLPADGLLHEALPVEELEVAAVRHKHLPRHTRRRGIEYVVVAAHGRTVASYSSPCMHLGTSVSMPFYRYPNFGCTKILHFWICSLGRLRGIIAVV